MTPISAILKQFETPVIPFPRAAVEEAVARRREITPELLRILEETLENAAQLAEDDSYMAHFYAMLLLAQFREGLAYPLVVRFAALPTEILDKLSDDFTTAYLSRVLASVSGGESIGIKSVIEDETADQWGRGAALESLLVLVANGMASREETISYFKTLYRGRLERRQSWVWTDLVGRSCDLHPGDLVADIEQAFADGLIDTTHIGFDEVKSAETAGQAETLKRLTEDHHMRLIDDTAAELRDWSCFDERQSRGSSPERAQQLAEYAQQHFAPESAHSVHTPLVSTKVGRNDPCPCGSGKKFKKCCGA